MTQKSTTDPPRIFQDGKLKPGIYKVQNLRSETYLDVDQHSKEMCCRPVRVSDAQKWDSKPLGSGYSVQRVSLPDWARPIVCPCVLSDASRLNRGVLNSFVPRWRGSTMQLRSSPSLILWLGELKWSTTSYFASMNTSGWSWALLDVRGQRTEAVHQVLLGTHEEGLGSMGRGQP